MFKLLHNKPEVELFIITQSNLIIINKKKELIKINDKNGGDEMFSQLNSFCKLITSGHYLYTSDNNNEAENYCFDVYSGKLISDFYMVSFINHSGDSIYKAFHLKSGGVEIYDIAANKKIKFLEGKFSLNNFLTKQYFIFNKRGTSDILLFTQNSQEPNWQTDLSFYGQIRKILGVAEELLWISCMSSDENRNTKAHLIALELKTGKIIHHLSDGLPLHEVHVELLEDKQRIVSIWGKMSSHCPAESPFVEINALTGEVLRNTYSQSMYNANLKLGAWKYLNDKIYFDAAFDTINSTHIGVMDYLTLEVEWFTEVIDRKAGLRNLQVTEDKIYIMDSGNQLFVYEKE